MRETVEQLIHYTISPGESVLTVEARSTLHAVHSKAVDLSGFVAVNWNGDGTLAAEPKPKMHVEFSINRLSSGNSLLDRQVQQLVDAGRFPKVSADLVDLTPSTVNGRFDATGEVTLAGRSHTYRGGIAIAREDDALTLDGQLNVDIRDFGLRPPNLLILKVEPAVIVRLRLVARKAA